MCKLATDLYPDNREMVIVDGVGYCFMDCIKDLISNNKIIVMFSRPIILDSWRRTDRFAISYNPVNLIISMDIEIFKSKTYDEIKEFILNNKKDFINSALYGIHDLDIISIDTSIKDNVSENIIIQKESLEDIINILKDRHKGIKILEIINTYNNNIDVTFNIENRDMSEIVDECMKLIDTKKKRRKKK